MKSETGFPSSHQLKSYVASQSRLKLAAHAVLSADAGLLVVGYYAEMQQFVLRLAATLHYFITARRIASAVLTIQIRSVRPSIRHTLVL